MKFLPSLLAAALFGAANWMSGVAHAAELKVNVRALEYKQGDTALEGWLAVPEGVTGKVPGVVVVHDWTGVQPYSKGRAEQLAALGYAALVVDIYGKGIRPSNPKDSAAEAGKYKSDRALYRQRLLAGLEELKKQPAVDPAKIAAIGYCFGGTGVLELARAGAPVLGVVSFHGGLDSPAPEDGKKIQAKVLILHGADDPYVPEEGIKALTAELNGAKVDWQMISYSGAVHSFTNRNAGTDPSKGNAYHPLADARSWSHMKTFLSELFSPESARQ